MTRTDGFCILGYHLHLKDPFYSPWNLATLNWLTGYPVENVGPALHGDALEDGENSKQDVVKLGDAIVWSQPVLSTHGAFWTQPWRRLCPTWKLFLDFTWTWMKVGRCHKTKGTHMQIFGLFRKNGVLCIGSKYDLNPYFLELNMWRNRLQKTRYRRHIIVITQHNRITCLNYMDIHLRLITNAH